MTCEEGTITISKKEILTEIRKDAAYIAQKNATTADDVDKLTLHEDNDEAIESCIYHTIDEILTRTEGYVKSIEEVDDEPVDEQTEGNDTEDVPYFKIETYLHDPSITNIYTVARLIKKAIVAGGLAGWMAIVNPQSEASIKTKSEEALVELVQYINTRTRPESRNEKKPILESISGADRGTIGQEEIYDPNVIAGNERGIYEDDVKLKNEVTYKWT